MIKRGILNEELSVDSHLRRENGSCPLMPEEVCSVLNFHFQIMLLEVLYFIYPKMVFSLS